MTLKHIQQSRTWDFFRDCQEIFISVTLKYSVAEFTLKKKKTPCSYSGEEGTDKPPTALRLRTVGCVQFCCELVSSHGLALRLCHPSQLGFYHQRFPA